MRFSLILLVVTFTQVSYGSALAESRRIVSLDGEWEVAESGMDARPARFDHKINVPGLIDMAQPPFEEAGKASDRREAFWYRRTFTIDGPVPAMARLKVLKAAFGTKVWVNGTPVGEHVGSFTPGWFDVTGGLKGNGEPNEIVIRVGGSPRAVPASVPAGFDFEKVLYTPGIYDSVQLILSGSPWIVNVQTVPQPEKESVRVVATIRSAVATSAGMRFSLRAGTGGERIIQVQVDGVRIEPAKDANVDVELPVKNCRLWSPEDPFLYTLEASTGQDSQRVRFGMRSFRMDKASGRALLNGKPYYLRGTNVCIFRFFEDAGRGDKPWRADWVRRLHSRFKDMHWNSARYCIGFPPELWYDVADELGFLIQDEFPVWHGDKVPAGFSSDELAREYREWVQERWNHPCVVIWDAQNETVTSKTGEAIQAVRALDLSNRPWDNGWSPPQSDADVFECHPYVFSNPEARLSNLPRLPATHLGNPTPNKNGNAMIINEYGWLWLNRDGTPTTLTRRQYESLLGTDATPAQRFHLYARHLAAMTEFWRSQRRFAGVLHFCGLTYSRPGGQTCDNFSDLETLTFEPGFYKYVRDAFAPVGIMIDEWAEELTAGERDVSVVAINDLHENVDAAIRLQLLDGNGKVLNEREQPCRIDPLGRTSVRFHLTIPVAPGKYQLVAELRSPPADPVESLRDFEVITPEEKIARTGLAVGKPVTASSTVTVGGETFPPSQAVDGDTSTRWSSEFSDPQWIAVDLGQATTISRVELRWEHAFARAYQIQVSQDGNTWTDVYKTTEGKGGKEVIRFSPTRARWVRVLGTARATQFGYSLWEISVFP